MSQLSERLAAYVSRKPQLRHRDRPLCRTMGPHIIDVSGLDLTGSRRRLSDDDEARSGSPMRGARFEIREAVRETNGVSMLLCPEDARSSWGGRVRQNVQETQPLGNGNPFR